MSWTERLGYWFSSFSGCCIRNQESPDDNLAYPQLRKEERGSSVKDIFKYSVAAEKDEVKEGVEGSGAGDRGSLRPSRPRERVQRRRGRSNSPPSRPSRLLVDRSAVHSPSQTDREGKSRIQIQTNHLGKRNEKEI